jgi:hypothetical protein
MSDNKKNYSGVKIVQQPGGNSNYSVGWGHQEEPIKKDISQPEPNLLDDKNPEKYESSSLKVIEQPGDSKRSKGIKVVNPPGGKSSFTFG